MPGRFFWNREARRAATANLRTCHAVTVKPAARPRGNAMRKIAKFLLRNRGLLAFMLCMVVFRSAVADWSVVPTGSMQPMIRIGDRILVDKLAYDVRLPLTHVSLLHLADP